MKKYLPILLAFQVFGNPQNATIRNGDVSIQVLSPEFLQIHADDNAIIDWNHFSIEVGEKTEFIQPHNQATVVNRVLEANPSRILGQLNANGKVVLVNPNGILVGKEAVIDTGSLIASTLDLNVQLFLEKGELAFEGTSQNPLVNEGTISSQRGDLFLIGYRVENKGSLMAQGGRAGAIGAHAVLLKSDGLFVRCQEIRDAENPYANAFSLNEGEIHNPGGTVYLLGDTVGIGSGAKIDASANSGGGQILIGGDYQGSNPDLWNSHLTVINQGSLLKADALQSGDGGKIIVWADGDTLFEGTLSALGKGSGVGGFAEVSGKRTLQYLGFADLRDELGNAGTLLLDPLDLAVTAGVTSIVPGGACPGAGFTYTAVNIAPCLTGCPACVAGGSIVNNTTLTGNLATCNVILTTVGTGAGCTGDIFIGAPIPNAGILNSAFSLTINSAHDIFVNANIQNQGTGGVTLDAVRNVTVDTNSPVAQSAVIGSRNGPTTVIAGGNLTMNGSNVLSRATQIGWNGVTGDVITGIIVVDVAGNITMSSGLGSPDVGTVIGHGSFGTNAGADFTINNANVNVRAGGNIQIISLNGSRKGSGIGYGAITSLGVSSYTGSITVDCGGNLTCDLSGVNVAGGSSALVGLLNFATFSNAGDTFDGSINVNVGGNFATLAPTGGNFFLSGIGTAFGNASHERMSVTANVAGTVTLNGPNAVANNYRTYIGKMNFSANATNITGAVTVNCCNAVTINGNRALFAFIGHGYPNAAAFTGNVPVNVTAQSVTLSNTNAVAPNNVIGVASSLISTVPQVGGDVRVLTSGPINFSGNGRVGINSNANVTVIAGGDITTAPVLVGFRQEFIGTERPASPAAFTTTILSGGNIIGTGNTTFGVGYIGNTIGVGRTCSLLMEAAGNIQIPTDFFTAAAGTITVTSDAAFAGASSGCITATAVAADGKGGILFVSGAGTAPNFTTTTGKITFTSAPLLVNSAFSNLTIGNAATNARFLSTSGAIEITQFHDININRAVTTAGNIDIEATHDLFVNATGSVDTSSGSGSITLLSGTDTSAGTGNLNLLSNITSNSGAILLQSGGGLGCSLASRVSSINQTAGTVTTSTGLITMNADFDLNISSLLSLNAIAGSIHTLAGHDTNLTNTTITVGGLEILMISGHNLNMTGATIHAIPSYVTLVVDNCFPTPPLIGPGAFIMDAASSIDPISLRVFTALQSQNVINGTLNGSLYVAGTLYTDTATEHWCQYFSFPFPYPFANLGIPFTIFYKDCLQQTANQAQIIVTEFLLDLHPYNEFPGWMERFWIRYQKSSSTNSLILPDEPFYFRRRNLSILNNPKTWTMLVE